MVAINFAPKRATLVGSDRSWVLIRYRQPPGSGMERWAAEYCRRVW